MQKVVPHGIVGRCFVSAYWRGPKRCAIPLRRRAFVDCPSSSCENAKFSMRHQYEDQKSKGFFRRIVLAKSPCPQVNVIIVISREIANLSLKANRVKIGSKLIFNVRLEKVERMLALDFMISETRAMNQK